MFLKPADSMDLVHEEINVIRFSDLVIIISLFFGMYLALSKKVIMKFLNV